MANANTPASFIAEGYFTDRDLDELGLLESKSMEERMTIDSEAEAFRSNLASEVARQALGPGECDRFGKRTAPARVKVLSAGAEPRNALRYALLPGMRGRFAVVSQFAMQSPKGKFLSMPVVRVEWSYRGDKASYGGATVALETDRLFVFEYGDPYVREAVASTLADFSVQAQLLVSPTGLLCGSRYEASDRAASLALAFVHDLVEALARFFVLVPDSPVGPGARWEVVEELESGVVRRTLYALSAASADSFEVLASSFATGAQHPQHEPWPFGMMDRVRLVDDDDLGARSYQETERGSLRIALHDLTRQMALHKQSLFLEGTDVVRVNDTRVELVPAIEGLDAYALPRPSNKSALVP